MLKQSVWWKISWLMVAWLAGFACRNSQEPKTAELAGIYDLRLDNSNCGVSDHEPCAVAGTILINRNHTFVFTDVPHCFSYESGCGSQLVNAKGGWTVFQHNVGWGIRFDWGSTVADADLYTGSSYEISFNAAPDPDMFHGNVFIQRRK